jgi:hypothetical protein
MPSWPGMTATGRGQDVPHRRVRLPFLPHCGRNESLPKGFAIGSDVTLKWSTTTCNPDFNLAQIGGIIRWTPVKNLTFSADVTYTMLDQKFAGLITHTAAINAIAKRQLRTSSRIRIP